MGFIRALIVLHHAYRHFPLRARAHVFVRFLTCPFLRLVQHVPEGAKLLDIGAGHGVLSVLARERTADITAVDPDIRKVRRVDAVRTVVGFDECIRGTFDVITMVDVLYLFPTSEWDALLERLRARLRPGGMLLVKEHDPTARVKQTWNRVQEWIVSPLRLTLGTSFSYQSPAELEQRLARHGFSVTHQRVDRGYPHPHVLYVARAVSSER